MARIYYDYEAYIEITDLINKLVNEYDSIKYDSENANNCMHRNNAEQIHTQILEKLSNYKKEQE